MCNLRKRISHKNVLPCLSNWSEPINVAGFAAEILLRLIAIIEDKSSTRSTLAVLADCEGLFV
jgi:hypothetical protein